MTNEDLTALDSLHRLARAKRMVRGGRRDLVELWAAIEVLARIAGEPDQPHVILGLTGRGGGGGLTELPLHGVNGPHGGGGGPGGLIDPTKGGIVLTGGDEAQAGPREPLRWPRPPTDFLEDS